jgi:hypothetical protein
MEYERTKKGLIQADLAKRLGTVLEQYTKCEIDEDKFEVSLTLAILQCLLTNCMELFNSLKKKERKKNPLNNELTENSSEWGISIDCVIVNTFEQGKLTYEKIFRHLRNSLSHPTDQDLNSSYLSTGYTTGNITKTIEKIIFIASPDVVKSRLKQHETYAKAESWKDNQGTFPENTSITEKDKKFIFTRKEKPFNRICRIELSPKQLLNLTYALCSYLSHPSKAGWDRNTFNISKIAA